VAVLFTVIQIFGPFVTQLLERHDHDRLQSVLWTATRWTVLLAAPILVLLALEGGDVLRLLHLPSDAGALAISVLATAFLVDAVTGPIGHVLTMSGRSGLNFTNAAVALAANVALNLLLIPKLGLVGAALSWALVIVAVNVARTLQVRAQLGIGPLTSSLWRPLAATAVAAGSALMVRVALEATHPSMSLAGGLCIRGGAFAAVYVTAAVLTARPEDRVLFRAVLGRNRAQEVVE
jgi:O-antigen/teichoic acid export membrane protein